MKFISWIILLKKFVPNKSERIDSDIIDHTRLFFISPHGASINEVRVVLVPNR